MRRKEYEGKDITVSFDLKRCVHARNCFLKLPTVFDPKQRPWVQPDNATADDVAAVVRTCPSGALAFHRETGVNETPPQINQIAVLENGPLALPGRSSMAARSRHFVSLTARSRSRAISN